MIDIKFDESEKCQCDTCRKRRSAPAQPAPQHDCRARYVCADCGKPVDDPSHTAGAGVQNLFKEPAPYILPTSSSVVFELADDYAAHVIADLRSENERLKARLSRFDGSSFLDVLERADLAEAERDRLRASILWALGYTPETGEPFRLREDGEGAYWWRSELRERSGITPPATKDKP
jgi:hypothetical protein